MRRTSGGHDVLQAEEHLARVAVGGTVRLVPSSHPEPRGAQRFFELRTVQAHPAVRRPRGDIAAAAGQRQRDTAHRAPCGRREPSSITGSCTNARPPGREHPRELTEIRRHQPALGQVLQDEVADERVAGGVLDGVEALAADNAEVDIAIGYGAARALEHFRRHVDSDHAVEAAGEELRHAPGPATDLDADAASRIGVKPAEEAVELGCCGRGVADVGVDGVRRRRGIPRRPHLVARHRQSVAL